MGSYLRLLLLVSGALNLFLLQDLGLIQTAVAASAGFGLAGVLLWDELRTRERDGRA